MKSIKSILNVVLHNWTNVVFTSFYERNFTSHKLLVIGINKHLYITLASLKMEEIKFFTYILSITCYLI